MDMVDDDYDEDHGVLEMTGELYATVEAQGEQPRFATVLEDAKKSLSLGSRHSKFSFSREDFVYQVSLSNWQWSIFRNYEAAVRRLPSESARIIVCCFGRSMKRRMCAQFARRLLTVLKYQI